MIENEGYLINQVKNHDKVEDAWVILDGEVYDITNFLSGHPGGMEILIEHLGTDIQEVFMEHLHSETAYNMLQRYHIGSLKGYRQVGPTTLEQIRKLKLKNGADNKSTVSGNSSNNNNNNDKLVFIDVKKPMVPQLKLLEGETYLKWIHSQTGLEEIIIFDRAWMEKFTRWPWWYIFILWVPIIVSAFGYSITREQSNVVVSSTTFLFGLFFWSFIEYILHRFIFHIKTCSYWGNFFHFFIHGIHHLTPFDSTRLTFPPMFSVLLGYGAWKLFLQFPDNLQITGLPWALFGGIACGYMLYDTVHYYFHHGEIDWLPAIFKKMKSNHLNHHYKDDNKNYGVTSPVFDYVFGTI
ncbi:fatty acid hydroxylase [Tieghemostelium lacteum]|uniref:Fatty acid 2-hydroxylase n=1 Tax=Tieghemostelium lacteum TaxID=361077 RepID=A0A152A4N8_TIELA|nr:fatty acid hydroxylase [Tieghemostelium lacteum]|eukprot:KYR01184.1 fatty acid hydroxylase [Tieghemostelium lacteum]